MNIGIIIIASGWAGAERVVYQLTKVLSKNRKLNITLFTNKEIFKNYLDIENIKRINLGNYNTKNKFLALFSFYSLKHNLHKYLAKNKYNLINNHMEFANVISPTNVNNISTFHGTDIKNFKKSPSITHKLFFYPRIKKRFLKSKRLISVSKGLIQNLPEKYKRKTIVIPNGVDTEIFKPLKNIKQKKNIILFTGRLTEIKGILEILEVAKQLPQYEFWFAGQGPLSNKIKGKNIKNFGFQKTKELIKLYNQATICISPSYREGFSNVGLEVTSCGRALICTSAFSEYIENGKDGIIIPAKDEQALKNAIVDLMENPVKRKMIEKNARKKALGYSWDKIAKQYLKVFKRVIER